MNIIGWLFIALGILGVVAAFFGRKDGHDAEGNGPVVAIVGSIICFAAGYFILR